MFLNAFGSKIYKDLFYLASYSIITDGAKVLIHTSTDVLDGATFVAASVCDVEGGKKPNGGIRLWQ